MFIPQNKKQSSEVLFCGFIPLEICKVNKIITVPEIIISIYMNYSSSSFIPSILFTNTVYLKHYIVTYLLLILVLHHVYKLILTAYTFVFVTL
jgi:hypothetical protein